MCEKNQCIQSVTLLGEQTIPSTGDYKKLRQARVCFLWTNLVSPRVYGVIDSPVRPH